MTEPSEYERLELNGVYAMLCEALRTRHAAGHDRPRETAAKTLKDVYGYEYHRAGGGCPWRLASTDHEWATNGMRTLGLSADRFESNAIMLSRMLDGDPHEYETVFGRRLEPMRPFTGSQVERFGLVESFHNAFRRITADWDSTLDRTVMNSNLERLLGMAAHAIRLEREGHTPDLEPMLALCGRRRA